MCSFHQNKCFANEEIPPQGLPQNLLLTLRRLSFRGYLIVPRASIRNYKGSSLLNGKKCLSRYEATETFTWALNWSELPHQKWVFESPYSVNRSWQYFESPMANGIIDLISAISKHLPYIDVQYDACAILYRQNVLYVIDICLRRLESDNIV